MPWQSAAHHPVALCLFQSLIAPRHDLRPLRRRHIVWRPTVQPAHHVGPFVGRAGIGVDARDDALLAEAQDLKPMALAAKVIQPRPGPFAGRRVQSEQHQPFGPTPDAHRAQPPARHGERFARRAEGLVGGVDVEGYEVPRRDAEHEADTRKAELIATLREAFTTPLQPEDIFELSRGLDEVMNGAKDTVRESIDYWIKQYKPQVRRFTPHDLRSTMKSHMRALGVPRDISEMCLNHKLTGVEGIYDQHTYYSERRQALLTWQQFLLACEVSEKVALADKPELVT